MRQTLALFAGMCVLGFAVAAPAAQVRVDSSIRYQTIDGLGTFFPAPELTPIKQDKLDDLYVNDLGASLTRMEILPDASTTPDLDLDHLNLDKLDMKNKATADFGRNIAALQKRFPGKVKVFASLWSPPGWMKDNGGPTHGGHLLANRREHLGKFIAAYCIAFEKVYDVHIDAVSLQNELCFEEFYNSCIYTPDTFRDTIKAVGEQFKKWGVTTKLMGPEDVGAGNDYNVQREMTFIRAAEADPAAAAALDQFNVHGYADDKTSSSGGSTSSWALLRNLTQGFGKHMWQTETSGEKHDLAGGLHIALDIHEALAYGNCNAWAYWQLFYYGPAAGEDLLLNADTTDKKYSACKQYFRFIRPGAVRVSASGDSATFFASAYVNDADKSLTIVLVNTARKEEPVHLTLPSYPKVGKMQVYRTDASESFQQLADLSAENGQATFTLPPQSIVTLTGIGTGDAPATPSVPTNLLAQALNESVKLTWTAGWHADSYVIQRATAEHGPFAVIAKDVTGSNYLDTGLTDGTSYYYQIASVNPAGRSPDSNLATGAPMAVNATYAATPPTLADSSDAQWSQAQWYGMGHFVRGPVAAAQDATGRFKVMWDAKNLYVLLETHDPKPTFAADKPFDTDGWEIYTDPTNSRRTAYGASDFHFVLPFNFNQVLEVAHHIAPDASARSFATPDGYVIKAQIPLKVLGVAGCNGSIFGIDFNLTDNKSGRERVKRAWWATSDDDWQFPANFGTARLTGASAPTPAAAPALTATPGNSCVTLQWKPIAGAVGYVIERAPAGQPPAPVASTSDISADAVQYVDRGLIEQTRYNYAVIPYSTGGLGVASQPVVVQPLTEQAPPGSVMIHCGGGATGRFAADEYFTGGSSAANYAGPVVRNVIDPAPVDVYQSERNGQTTGKTQFGYSIPHLKPGARYKVRLHFCENYWTDSGQRIFSVLFNGKEVLTDFDIFKEAGGAHAAVIREFDFTAPESGMLDITFPARRNVAIIQGIEVIPQ